jgi:Calcineurin-like phosphoesterase
MDSPHPAECPHPTAETVAQLEFVRQKKMVDWLHPVQLARTGLKSAIASTFGSYADKRELQAAMAHVAGADDTYDFDANGELWFDYTADLGDGFDATYSVARMLCMDLELDGHRTKRGRFVILGGDQVYPTAARDDYQNRFIGPYRAALPFSKEAPAMYALPGNHDWYDGLTSFLRIFCQRKDDRNGRWIGGWRTRQRRSYFALELPENWWVWAIDSQLEADMDHPQLVYFDNLTKEMLAKEPDPSKHRIILITAEPSWVNCPGEAVAKTCRNHAEAFNTLAHFEKAYVRTNGFQLKLVLSGDLHHYVRYESVETTRVTAGGGGAFLLGTEQMPAVLAVRDVVYEKRGSFPDEEQSRSYTNRIAGLPFRNRPFGLMLGAVYLLFAWLLQMGSRGVFKVGSLLDVLLLRNGPLADFAAFGVAFLFSPLSVAMGLAVIGGLGAFTAGEAKGHRRVARFLGFVHGFAHLVVCCALFSWIAVGLAALGVRTGITFNLLLMIALFFLGWLGGSWLFAAYLWLSSRWTGVHTGELFSSMAITDCRNFLRMRIDRSGKLTVYAVGLKKVAGDWVFIAPGENCGQPWFRSETFGTGDHAPHLIEKFER